MASSQVEIASSSPFGCVLRDHNLRDRCRESTAFQKNIKDLVTCINISQDSSDNDPRRNLNFSSGKQETNAIEQPLSLSTEHSMVLNQLAAEHARDMISAVQKQINEADLPIGSTSILSPEAGLPTASEPLADPSNLAASSLVQMWEARLGLSQGSNKTPTSSTSRRNSPFTCSNDEQPQKPEVGETYEENLVNYEGSGEWEIDEAVPEAPRASSFSSTSSSSCQERDSDPGKCLKTPRVADIIRRLIDNEPCTNAEVECPLTPSLDLERCPGSDHPLEKRAFKIQMTNSPRLRGRQAFNDLLMNMERDRQRELGTLGERRAVSRFSQKGRIQSMLRLKLLQRGMGINHQVQYQCRPPSSALLEKSSVSSTSTSVNLRGKFKETSSPSTAPIHHHLKSSSIDRQTQSSNQCSRLGDCDTFSSTRSIVSEVQRDEELQDTRQSSLSEKKEITQEKNLPDERNVTSNNTYQEVNSKPTITEDRRDKRSHTSDETYQEICSEAIKSEHVHNEKILTEDVICPETGLQVISIDVREQPEPFIAMKECWYEEGSEELEEQESNMEEEAEDSEYDFFLGVSRPRSFWEDRRQAWYKDVLETKSEDSDIRRLLERRRVSTFLTSDFRDRMDSLMVCHAQRANHQMSDQEDDMSSNERVNPLLSSFFLFHSKSAGHREDEHDKECEESEEEEVVQVEEAKAQGPVEGKDIYLKGQQRPETAMEEDTEEEEELVFFRGRNIIDKLASPHSRADSVVGKEVQPKEREEEGKLEAERQSVHDIYLEQGDIAVEEDYEREERNDGMDDFEGEKEESPSGRGYDGARKYFDLSDRSSFKTCSPTYMGSWCYNSCETNHNNRRQSVASTSPEPFSSSPYHHDSLKNVDSIYRLSMEMELINDLRGQMKHLYQEMAELRKTINSCIQMQSKFQDSMKNEMDHPVRCEGIKPQKGMCCICHEMKVDSLLYKCGHMCTCLKCAHKLQSSSGKCPICQAPIMDVVKAHINS